MTADPRRITLINRPANGVDRDWIVGPDTPSRVIFVNALNVLQHALRNAVLEFHRDVERVVIDRVAGSTQFLELLARLPHEYHGDALLIRHDGSGFLSAISRGDGRMLYALGASDVDFYLATNGLTAMEAARLTA
jgi:hypothetical protein